MIKRLKSYCADKQTHPHMDITENTTSLLYQCMSGNDVAS